MPRVLYSAFDVVPSPKGASTHITYFVRGLVAQGYDVQLFTVGDGILPEHDMYEGAMVTRVPTDPNENFLERAITFGQAIMEHVAARERYDVVHYRSVWSGWPLAQQRQLYGYKTLFEVNGLQSVELKYHYPALRDSPLLMKIREQELATLALSDAIICPSDVTRAYLTSLGVLQKRITVIPNGISSKDFQAAPLLFSDGHTPTILYIGTLADWQGLEVLIEAMPIVLQSHQAKVRIVGRGRKRSRKLLTKQIRKLNLQAHVSVEPAVPHHEIPALIASADVCVAPLALNDRNVTQGCCPLKVIEYMAIGRPLVAANLPVVRELAREDIDALLFAPNDAQDLARQIVRVLRDRILAETLATNAAQHAHQHLTWHQAQKKLGKVYEKLVMSNE
jgi:glycosyltransferase involved in cell wall biosynthesis